jgi:hypothetical protein
LLNRTRRGRGEEEKWGGGPSCDLLTMRLGSSFKRGSGFRVQNGWVFLQFFYIYLIYLLKKSVSYRFTSETSENVLKYFPVPKGKNVKKKNPSLEAWN